jgi:hypothetical protein
MLMTTNATAEPLSQAARLILDALKECGPLSRQELATLLGETRTAIGTRLYLLARDGLVALAADDTVALAGQRLDSWLPDEERVHQQRRWLWQTQGLVTLVLDEVPDAYLAQQIRVLAVQLYGRRRAGA